MTHKIDNLTYLKCLDVSANELMTSRWIYLNSCVPLCTRWDVKCCIAFSDYMNLDSWFSITYSATQQSSHINVSSVTRRLTRSKHAALTR